MQTLGLAAESKRSDGWLKSIFWPTVENAWDVDYLGQQGMWICTAIAALTFFSTLLTGSPLFIAIGVLTALVFLIGGMGVRQGSWPAAALIFTIYLLGFLSTGVGISPFAIIRIVTSAVLLANVRAAFLASEWKPAPDEDRPTRFSESLGDKFVDQMPQKMWPKLQIPFWILGISLLLLTMLGMAMIFVQRLGLIPHQ